MATLITRLITGEEILGEVESLTNNECKILNPTQIAVAPNPKTGNVDVHMAPFAPLAADKHIVVNLNAVLCQYSPVTEVLNKYNTMFGSGLIIPNSGELATL